MARKFTEQKKDPVKRGPNMSPHQIAELIKKKAFEVYCKRGNKPGDATSDWLTAEKQVREELRSR